MKRLLTLFFAVSFATALFAQEVTQEDLKMAQKIKTEATKNSHINNLIYKIVDLSGPSFAGSDGAERGMVIAKNILDDYGLTNTRIEFAKEFPHGGWDNKKSYLAMTAPYHISIFGSPVAWTGSTNGEIRSEVISINAVSVEDLKKYKGKLKNRIVLMPSTQTYVMSYEPSTTRHSEESLKKVVDYPLAAMPLMDVKAKPARTTPFSAQLLEFVRSESPALILHGDGNFNNPRGKFNKTYKRGEKESPCEVNITLEIHSLMERLIANGETVKLEAEIINQFTPKRDIYNVIGEIPGNDPLLKDQIVLVGAHLDSYPMGGGAADDAAGVIAMTEAVRILKAIGFTPKRTIKLVLWGGEEVGLYGSNGYVDQFVYDSKNKKELKEYNKLSAYFNSDYGPGKFRGIFTQDNLIVNPIFQQWSVPFHDMGFTAVSNKSVGSTDHVPFNNVGIPAFQFIQDNLEWGRSSHASVDYAERLIPSDLQHNAIIIAWFVYKTSEMDQMMPRK